MRHVYPYLCSTGGGGPTEPGVHPGQPDLPQEVPRPGGGEHAGGPSLVSEKTAGQLLGVWAGGGVSCTQLASYIVCVQGQRSFLSAVKQVSRKVPIVQQRDKNSTLSNQTVAFAF